MVQTKRDYFRDVNGGVELTGDGVYSTGAIDPDYEYAVVNIATFDVNGDLVTATAGTATIEFLDSNGQSDTGVADGENPIDLTLCGPSTGYVKPLYLGDCVEAKVTISGLTGAETVKAFLKRG